MKEENAIIIENLTKVYTLGKTTIPTLRGSLSSLFKNVKEEKFVALDNITLKIKKGESIGIIGRNGAGKSTLLKILSRITYPTKGRIIIDGHVNSLLEVGTGFHPELTGKENIFLNGSLLGMSRKEIKEKLNNIISFSGLSKFMNTPIKRYSSGMYTRLAFSVAAHLNSDILIIDEILAVGDLNFQKKCLGKMDEIKGGDKTLIFVSHNLSHIKDICDRVLLLDNGTLVYDGPPEETIKKYVGKSYQSSNYFKGPLKNKILNFYFYLNGISIESEKILEVKSEDTIEIKTKIYGKIKKIKFYLSLFTDSNERLLTINNNKFCNLHEQDTHVFRIPANLLRPGQYRVGFGGLTEDIQTSPWIWNEEVFKFHVSPVWSKKYQELNEGIINLENDT